jgi:hypothetical protein
VTESPDLHAGDSAAQRRAEGLMLDALEVELKDALQRRFVLSVGAGARMEFDAGIGDVGSPVLLVEAWAHQGSPKAAQKKIVGDAFKLAYAATLFSTRPRLILLFSDEAARSPFISPRAWSSAAFAVFRVETCVVDLPPHERQLILEAQARQFR